MVNRQRRFSFTIAVALVFPGYASALELQGPIRLPQVIEAALAGSPELAADNAGTAVLDARTRQAGLRPNPVLTIGFEDFAGTGQRSGVESIETTQSVSQLIETGGKRAGRVRVAELSRDTAAGRHLALQRAVVSETIRAFVDVLIAQKLAALADDLVRLSRTAVESVAASVTAGAVSPVEEQRAAASLARAQAESMAAQRELDVARVSLSSVWGSAAPDFSRAEGELEPLADPPGLAPLLMEADRAPELARFEIELAQRRAEIDLARSSAVPDITVYAGLREYADEGDGALLVGFQIPLPVFDRNQGNILAAERELSRTELERAAAGAQVRARIRRAHDTMRSAFAQAATLRDVAIPTARRAHEGALDAYSKGLFRYLEVLDTQRTMYELRVAYYGTLTTYHRAAADLTRWRPTIPQADSVAGEE